MISSKRLQAIERKARSRALYVHIGGAPYYLITPRRRVELTREQWIEETAGLPSSQVIEVLYSVVGRDDPRPTGDHGAIVYDEVFRAF